MEQLAGYRLVTLLAEGGMGKVHLGRSASGRLVAVKTVHEHLAADPRFRERFRREVLAARAVEGPFTAATLDADPEAELPWLATEFCAGPTLSAALAALGPLRSGELATLGAALGEALAAIHGAGLIHRDLKPSNVVITRDGPTVIDFGIARMSAEESLTASGEVVGSPGFIAPELLTETGEPGPAADVFALGALLANAATGRAPFGSGEVHQVLYRTMHGSPDLDGLPDGPGWEELLSRCLDRDPAERPPVAEVLGLCAEWAAEGEPWWEREAVLALIRRREEEVAALVARQPDAVEAEAEAEAATRVEAVGREPDAPGTYSGGTTATAGVVQAKYPWPSRRRLLRWGGSLIAAGSGVATVLALDSTQKDGLPAAPRPSSVRHVQGRPLWTRDIGETGLIPHGEMLYLLDDDTLTRLDSRTGTVRWTYRTEGIADAVPSDGMIHVVHSAGLLSAGFTALDPATGRERWTVSDLQDNPRRPPALDMEDPADRVDGSDAALSVSAGLACLVTYTDYGTLLEQRHAKGRRWRAYGFDPRTGDDLWFHQGTADGVAALHQAGGRIAVAVARGDRTEERKRKSLYVLSAEDGKLDQEIPGGSLQPEAHPGSSGVRYYATESELSAVDLATRRTRWRRRPAGAPDRLLSPPAITPTAADGLVYTAAGDELHALDAHSGRTRWRRRGVLGILKDSQPPVVARGLVFVIGPQPGTPEPKKTSVVDRWGVHALDARSGDVVWAAEANDAEEIRVTAEPGLVHVSAERTLITYAMPERA